MKGLIMVDNTLIINLFAGPGSGKSTMAGGLFNILKTEDHNIEYVQEFAKTLTWEKNHIALSHQFYVSAVQDYTQNMLLGQVEAVITDSPILLGLLYYKEPNTRIAYHFTRLLLERFNAQNNINFFIKRKKKYNPIGRNQTEDESIQIDKNIEKLLLQNKIPYHIVEGNDSGKNIAYSLIIERLKQHEQKETNK